MMPIAQRLLAAKNDARQSGKIATAARIHPADMRQLDIWIRQQNQPSITGLPAQNLSKDDLWGMKIKEDATVREILVLEFANEK